jgi:hypothetical protein
MCDRDPLRDVDDSPRPSNGQLGHGLIATPGCLRSPGSDGAVCLAPDRPDGHTRNARMVSRWSHDRLGTRSVSGNLDEAISFILNSYYLPG